VGDKVSGVVHRVTDFGVFVKLSNTSIVALSRRDTAISDPSSNSTLDDEYVAGDVVRAKILKINKSTLRIELGLSSKYFSVKEKYIETGSENEDEDDQIEVDDAKSVEQFSDIQDEEDSDEEINQIIKVKTYSSCLYYKMYSSFRLHPFQLLKKGKLMI
jgi:rRNA biogenesis protein RRP5